MTDDRDRRPPHSAEPGQEVLRPGRWTCRLHIWHRWRTHTYPGAYHFGSKYQECLDCGKQRDVPVGGGAGLAGPYREDD